MLGKDEMAGNGRRVRGRLGPRLLVGTNHLPPHPWLWNMWITRLLRLSRAAKASTQVTGDCRRSAAATLPERERFQCGGAEADDERAGALEEFATALLRHGVERRARKARKAKSHLRAPRAPR